MPSPYKAFEVYPYKNRYIAIATFDGVEVSQKASQNQYLSHYLCPKLSDQSYKVWKLNKFDVW